MSSRDSGETCQTDCVRDVSRTGNQVSGGGRRRRLAGHDPFISLSCAPGSISVQGRSRGCHLQCPMGLSMPFSALRWVLRSVPSGATQACTCLVAACATGPCGRGGRDGALSAPLLVRLALAALLPALPRGAVPLALNPTRCAGQPRACLDEDAIGSGVCPSRRMHALGVGRGSLLTSRRCSFSRAPVEAQER